MSGRLTALYADFLARHQASLRTAGIEAAIPYAERSLARLATDAVSRADEAYVAISPLEFNASLYGFPMGRVDFALESEGSAGALAACFAVALERAEDMGMRLLFYRVPATAVAPVAAAQASGLAVVTANMYFEREVAEGSAAEGVRVAREADLAALTAITRDAFRGGDPLPPRCSLAGRDWHLVARKVAA